MYSADANWSRGECAISCAKYRGLGQSAQCRHLLGSVDCGARKVDLSKFLFLGCKFRNLPQNELYARVCQQSRWTRGGLCVK